VAREWYVFKLGKRQDPSGRRVGQGQGEQDAPRVGGFARPVQPRRRERDIVAEILEDDNEQAAVDPGFGFTILREDRKDMDLVFTSNAAAEAYAKEQAEKNPKTLFGVFSCTKVFETTTPTIIEKTYNDAGELLVVNKP
jgi:CubicO group peptidase (beta-lactamase class C family)